MKILYRIYPEVIGGMEVFLFDLIKHLDRKIFEPILFSWKKGAFIDFFKPLTVKTIIIKGGLADKLDKLLEKEKIKIAQTNSYSADLAMAAKIRGVPHIWVVGGHAKIALAGAPAKKKDELLQLMSCLSDKIICPSDFIKSQFAGEDEKTKVIYNGVDFSRCRPSVIAPETVERKGPCIGMVAHLLPSKRHIDFIRAAGIVKKKIPRAKFFIFGGDYPGEKNKRYANSLREKVRKMCMEKEVIFTGHCPDVIKYMGRMDLLVMPFLDEAFGISIVEAMAMKKPVIAAMSGAAPEIIKDGITGILVPPKEPKRLAIEIIHLLNSPEKANQIAAAAKKSAEKLFNIKDVAKEYEKLYLSLCLC